MSPRPCDALDQRLAFDEFEHETQAFDGNSAQQRIIAALTNDHHRIATPAFLDRPQ